MIERDARAVSIILPTYNEAGNVLTLIREIKVAIPDGWNYEVLVVDDNSPDGTYEAVRGAFPEDPAVRPTLRTVDRGFAKSIRHGIESARYPRIVVMDSDLTHDPAELPQLLHVSEMYDIVTGSRFCAGGRMASTAHYIFSMTFNWGLRLLLRTQIQDNLGGYFTMRRDAALALPIDSIFYGYGEYFFRLLYFAQRYRLSLVELPANYRQRATGKSKSNWGRMVLSYTSAAIALRWANRGLRRRYDRQ